MHVFTFKNWPIISCLQCKKNEWTSACDITYTKWPISCSVCVFMLKKFRRKTGYSRRQSSCIQAKHWKYLQNNKIFLPRNNYFGYFLSMLHCCIYLYDDPSRGYLDSLFSLFSFCLSKNFFLLICWVLSYSLGKSFCKTSYSVKNAESICKP